jgi:predicted ArsR family transcriptional regulator
MISQVDAYAMKRDSPEKADRLLFHLVCGTYKVVKDSADPEVLEGLFRSYGYNSAIAFSNNLADRMTGFSPSEKIMAAWMWGNHAFTSAAFEYSASKDTAVLVNKACPFRFRAPAVCRVVCTHMAKPMADFIWPDCFFCQTPRAEDNDLCIWIADSRGIDPGVPDPDVLLDADKMLDRISEEESQWLHSHVLGELWNIGVLVAVDILGEEQARASLVAVAKNEGELLATEKRGRVDEDGKVDAALQLLELMKEAGLRGELEREREADQVIIVKDCPLKGGYSIACLQVEALIDSFVRNLDPSFSYHYREMGSEDGGRCVAVLRSHRVPGTAEAPLLESEPLKILLSRLARGEISVDEYKAMKEFIEQETSDRPRQSSTML